MSRMIRRDPFAREELHRTTVVIPSTSRESCAWCGNTNARGNLYRYRTETDGGRTHDHPKLFCSESCRKAYEE